MTKSDVVLFMKGDRNTPRCGFSQKLIGILNAEEIEYTTFDILSDDSVRQSKPPAEDRGLRARVTNPHPARVASQAHQADRQTLSHTPSTPLHLYPFRFSLAELKEINTWPTFPQLIIKGEFVGGLDVVQEMVEAGELREMLA